MQGNLKKNLKIRLLATQKDFEVISVGAFAPHPVELEELAAGEVGFVIANIKQVADTRIGDTITEVERPAPALPGFKPANPMVFAGIFPTQNARYTGLADPQQQLH